MKRDSFFEIFYFFLCDIPGGYFPKIWVGVCGALLETLTLFQTKICDSSLPYFRPDLKFDTLFQTRP